MNARREMGLCMKRNMESGKDFENRLSVHNVDIRKNYLNKRVRNQQYQVLKKGGEYKRVRSK